MALLSPGVFVLATLLGLLHFQHAVGQGNGNGNAYAYGQNKGSSTTTTTAASTAATTTASTSTASAKGDPMMSTFDGRTFEFIGEVGAYYNVISEKHHQVSMKLKLGQMWNHNGTYMDGVGFKYQDHEVIVEEAAVDNMHVYLDGKRLQMGMDEYEQEHVMRSPEAGKLFLLWQLHRPDMGQTVEITTNLLSMTIHLTPAGTRDEGGVLQPAYLNFDVALLGPPDNGMAGIVGESYALVGAGLAALAAEVNFKFHGVEADYKLDSYFDTTHEDDYFNIITTMFPRRRLIERASVAFPLRASAGPAARPAAATGRKMI